MTAEKIIKTVVAILEAYIESCHQVADLYEADGDKRAASNFRKEACDMRSTLWMLTDENYRNDMAKLFFDK